MNTKAGLSTRLTRLDVLEHGKGTLSRLNPQHHKKNSQRIASAYCRLFQSEFNLLGHGTLAQAACLCVRAQRAQRTQR